MIDLLRMLPALYRAPPAEEGAPRERSLFDLIRLQAMIYEESRRLQDLLLERLLAPAARPAMGGEGGEGTEDGAGPVAELLRRAQLLVLKHPVAAQAAFAALIAEGRRFAETPEGAAWAAALAGSDLVRRGRQVWDAVGMNMLEDDPDAILPSAYLEALLRAARSPDLEATLRGLYDATKGDPLGAAR
ncbi:hypothetical protein WMF04_01535 [Sorangium sp. So ce260]|uniref:hypothetical protein n=1 Tax=Sorangium sp. So ce260 TaxID=3133291 RepID=UPI003F5F5C82